MEALEVKKAYSLTDSEAFSLFAAVEERIRMLEAVVECENDYRMIDAAELELKNLHRCLREFGFEE